MEEKDRYKNDELEIDLQRLILVLLNKAWMIGLAAIVCAVLTLVGTFFFITPKYQASAMFYVNNSAPSLRGASPSISSSDLSVSRGLVKSYIVILESRETLIDVMDHAGVDYSYEEMRNMIRAEAVDSTEIFRVTVTSPDPQEAERIADAVTSILPKRISGIIEGTSAKIVDAAELPSRPSSPGYVKNAAMGFLMGAVLAAAFVILRQMWDTVIQTEEEITEYCPYPLLASIPDMQYEDTVGSGISVAASEAYKLLRTKLQFAFADEENCRVIGITGSGTGEGKSLSAVNLAYTLSQLGKRVLLIDGDMRQPTIQTKLPIHKKPGLSDFLAGQSRPEDLIQMCGIGEDPRAFHVISSGSNPPNPMELLSSARMERMMARLRGNYDYILMDLPPVGQVGDALAASKLTDGILLVVRRGMSDRVSLNAAVRQLEFVDARILGVVFNGTSENAKYGRKYRKCGYGTGLTDGNCGRALHRKN